MSTGIQKLLSQQVSKQKGNPTAVEEVYVIPSGQELAVDTFAGGHEYSTKECRCELVWRVGETDEIVACGYGSSFSARVKRDFMGDGNKAMVIRLVNGDSSDLHMTGSWYGVLV